MSKYDVIIVGAGFSGSVLARKLAEEKNKKVLILEKRNHIAGNAFDFVDESGIRIQKYGPHTFHTNIDDVYNFITKYCELDNYHLKCEAIIDGVATPSPFNYKTIDQFYNDDDALKLKEKLNKYFGKSQATVLEMLECDDEDIKKYAEFLFDKDYSLYTAKQWGKKPEEIDPSILKRVPIIFSYRDTYFSDKYEGIPINGFTELFEHILNHPNISIELNIDAFDRLEINENEKIIYYLGEKIPVIYTGAIDELFKYRYGKLPYRSLNFKYKYLNKKSYQNVAIVAHPADVDYTRITEYTKLPYQEVGEKTVIAYEYSLQYNKDAKIGNEPYYPVLTEDSQKQYSDYLEYSKEFTNLTLCGRLADFRYYNMDMAIKRALKVYEELERKL